MYTLYLYEVTEYRPASSVNNEFKRKITRFLIYLGTISIGRPIPYRCRIISVFVMCESSTVPILYLPTLEYFKYRLGRYRYNFLTNLFPIPSI